MTTPQLCPKGHDLSVHGRKRKDRPSISCRACARAYFREWKSRKTFDADSFWSKVTKGAADECWTWMAARYSSGYGSYRDRPAHRVSYEQTVGPIPEGMEIDHLCRNKPCVNPAHLEPVTPQENSIRANARPEACVNGHPYDEANTYWRQGRNRYPWRGCRACSREARARSYARKKAVA